MPTPTTIFRADAERYAMLGGVTTMPRPWLALPVFATLAVIAACGSSPTPTLSPTLTPSPTPTLSPTPTPSPSPALSPAPALSPGPMDDADEADTLRQLAFAYWEAFNAYDADTALGYLEEDYRRQRDETVRSEIGRIALFRVKLGVSEETPPSVVSHDEREMYLTMKDPLGTRRIHMAFRDVAGEWKITFAEEAK